MDETTANEPIPLLTPHAMENAAAEIRIYTRISAALVDRPGVLDLSWNCGKSMPGHETATMLAAEQIRRDWPVLRSRVLMYQRDVIEEAAKMLPPSVRNEIRDWLTDQAQIAHEHTARLIEEYRNDED